MNPILLVPNKALHEKGFFSLCVSTALNRMVPGLRTRCSGKEAVTVGSSTEGACPGRQVR